MFEHNQNYKYKLMPKAEQKQITFIIISIFINILLVSGLFISYQSHENSSNELATKVDSLYKSNKKLETLNTALLAKLEAYEANEAYLQSIGASKEQARTAIKAARIHHIDPRLLGALIKSESNFVNKNHDLKHVIGIAGINIACGSILPYDVYSDDGNIMNAAKLLQDYKIIYKTDLKAIARYKGYSKEGFKQARNVINIYNNTL